MCFSREFALIGSFPKKNRIGRWGDAPSVALRLGPGSRHGVWPMSENTVELCHRLSNRGSWDLLREIRRRFALLCALPHPKKVAVPSNCRQQSSSV